MIGRMCMGFIFMGNASNAAIPARPHRLRASSWGDSLKAPVPEREKSKAALALRASPTYHPHDD